MEVIMKEKIEELIELKKFKEAKLLLDEYNSQDIAELIEDLDTKDIAKLFRLVKKDDAADALALALSYLKKEDKNNGA